MKPAPMTPCAECGMYCAAGEFHPYAACLMFKACHNSRTVRENLQFVMDWGRDTPRTYPFPSEPQNGPTA